MDSRRSQADVGESWVQCQSGELPSPQRDYIQRLRQAWRPVHPRKLAVPETWLSADSSVDEQLLPDLFWDWERAISATFLSNLRDRLDTLSSAQLRENRNRHWDATIPDFMLATVRSGWKPETLEEGGLAVQTIFAKSQMLQMLLYDDRERDADVAMAGCFQRIPSAHLRMFPSTMFPGSDENEDNIQFASVRLPFASTQPERDHLVPICLLHPALIIGTKGLKPWHRGERKMPHAFTSQEECLEHSFRCSKPSLDVLLMAWNLSLDQISPDFENPVAQAPPFPPWAFLIGIVYDAESLSIIAHIPVRDEGTNKAYTYRTCVIDTLILKAEPNPDIFERLRVAIALITLQRHVSRVLTIWDHVHWPSAIFEKELERLEAVVGVDLDGTHETQRFASTSQSSDEQVNNPGKESVGG